MSTAAPHKSHALMANLMEQFLAYGNEKLI